MPKRREGPRRDKKTGFYYFDEYVGLGQDKQRIRFSLKTKDPDKARWRWEQEYRKHWSKYYGIESRAKCGNHILITHILITELKI